MKISLTSIAAALALAIMPATLDAESVNVVPRPAMEQLDGRTISAEKASGLPVREKTDAGIENPEGYVLKISEKKIEISACSEAGFFYARQTLAQEIASGTVHCGTVTDYPRYPWRGFMLDESRHFAGEKRVKELLDMMAYFKMNKFHWHLTDAQGWRIEIKKYPRLNQAGAKGSHSEFGKDIPEFYTQEQIRDIVEYAAQRHIEIIPEIDMPGHASAAGKAYPQYSGGGVSASYPDFTFNVGKEETYTFLSDILKEVADLFPSKYIHIGGDEVSYGSYAWLHDKDILAMMKREGFTTTKEAENYFIDRMSDSLKVLGKTLIGWDDMLDLKCIEKDDVIMWWRHDNTEHLRRSLGNGYVTILCPRRPMYFDFVQDDRDQCGRRWDGFCPLDEVYGFPDALIGELSLTEEQMKPVIGLQSNVWTELIHTKERFDYMTWPRLCATAECGWTLPENKDYESFCSRMNYIYPVFDERGIGYYDARNPERTPEVAGAVFTPNDDIILDNASFRLTLSSRGWAKSLISKVTDEELLEDGVKLPFCSLSQDRPYDNENFLTFPAKPRTFPASKISMQGDTLLVEFKDTYDIAVIKTKVTDEYISFQLVGIDYRIEDIGVKRKTEIDDFALVQLPLTKKKNFGEWLNASWDSRSTACLMGANPMTRIDAFDRGTYREMYAGGEDEVGITGIGAILTVSRTEDFMNIMDGIEQDFNMPRGVKGRRESTYPLSYYELRNATPDNIEQHLEYARKGGFTSVVLYYPDFAWTCGHFLFNKAYRNGIEDLKKVTSSIRDAGMIPGIHIHYSKVSTDDPYVTGTPDPRLGTKRCLVLKKPLTSKATEIEVDENPSGSFLEEGRRVLWIDNEMISYEGFTTERPYRYYGCRRGVFGTKPAAHSAGSTARIPDIDDWPRFIRINQSTSLQDEVAENLRRIYDEAGFEFVYFDGAEDVGKPYWYNVSKAQLAVYDKLSKKPLYCEGALKSHYGWHILSRGNAFDIFMPEKMREGMKKYTLRCAELAAEDFSSIDFGWIDYKAADSTTMDLQPDMLEYACSKAYSWNSPVSLMGHLDRLAANPMTEANLEVVRRWEDAKRSGFTGTFSKEEMRDPEREFVLLPEGLVGSGRIFEIEMIGNIGDVRAFSLKLAKGSAIVCWDTTGANEQLASRMAALGQVKRDCGRVVIISDADGAILRQRFEGMAL